MALSSDLLSQFIKATNDKNDSKSETIVYGTIVKQADSDYVKIDGSELLTPVISTTVVKDGDKVTVMIKNHSAIVTGNITNPSAQNGDLQDVSDQISEVEILIADKVSTDELEAEKARIDELIADNVIIRGELEASSAKIDDIVADNIVINEKFTAFEADIEYIKANSLTVDVADLKYATIESLEATNAKINNLEVTYGEFYEVVTDELSAINANIENLNTEYATIDFANIGKAAIEEFFSKSGMISDLVVGDGTVTGELIGVTISGDLIKGNTIIAEKLVIKGEDGLYYRLNTDGMTTEVEQTDENSLNGQIIQAQSITATKIKVSDLYAFGATIGGFVITEDSIHSHLKDYVNNNSRGIYLDNTGQISFGDATNYVKFYKDADGNYRLAISASSISFSSGTSGGIEDAITNTEEEFYLSTSPTVLSGGSWSKNQPTWQNGKYIWRRTLVTCIDGTKYYTPSQNGVCITGNTGEPGKDGADGTDGTPGKDGVSIQSIQEKYAVSSSNSTPPSSWYDEVPNMTPTNKYLWNYEIITYSDKRTETTSKRVIGAYGNTGPQGPAGADGADGKPGSDGVGIKSITNYYLISSQNTGITVNTSGWSTTPSTTTTTNKYLWNYEAITYTNGSTVKGTPHIIGTHGATGQNGATGPKGDPGISVKSIKEKYAVSSSNSNIPSSWSDTVPTMTITNKYLWNYEIITYSDNHTEETSKRVIGVYGNTGPQGPAGADGKPGATGSPGADGVGIKTITNYYLVSSQNTGITVNTSGWTTTPPTTTTTNKYLWNYEAITYTNGNVVKGTPRIIGTHGATGPQGPNGANGISISKTEVFYYLSTSSTTQTGGSWVTTPPAWVSGKYYWQKIKTTFSNGSSSESKPVCITGAKGQNGSTGAAGQSVTSVTAEYYLSTSKTTQTGGSWVTTMPTWSSGKYLWIRNKIVYANPAKTAYTTPYCDSSWEAVNEIEVGGRNLLRRGNILKGSNATMTFDESTDTYTITSKFVEGGYYYNYGFRIGNAIKPYVIVPYGRTLTISVEIFCSQKIRVGADINNFPVEGTSWSSNDHDNVSKRKFGNGNIPENEWTKYYIQYENTNEKNVSKVDLRDYTSFGILTSFPAGTTLTWKIRKLKAELGNKATDWTPAPEDVDADINDAAKTATNFLTYDSTNGLLIGNKTSGSWVGYRTQITASAFNILNESGVLLASYGATKIELGKNSINSIIEMCGGKAKIQYVTDNNTNYIEVNSENIRLRGNTLSSLYTFYNSGSGYAARSGVNAGRGFVEVYTMSSGNADPVTGEGTFDQSTLSLEPLEASIDSDGSVNILSGMGIDISAMQNIYIGSMNGSVIINGYTVGTSNGDTNTKRIPVIGSDGVMEVGTYIDFHPSGSSFDYSPRLQAGTGNVLICSGSFTASSLRSGTGNQRTHITDNWIGFYRASDGARVGWIGANSYNNIYITAEQGIVQIYGELYLDASGTRIVGSSYNGSNNLYLRADSGYTSIYSHNRAVYYNGKYIDSNWSGGKFYPGGTGVPLGGSASSERWYRLYAANACNTSSDRRLKENITYFNEMPTMFNENEDNLVEAFFKDLKPSSFTMIGDKYDRLKFGFIAQDVIESLNRVGLTAYDVDFVSHGRDEDGNINEEAMYSLCYEEFIALNTHMIQKAFSIIKKQNEEISKLKEQLSRII